MILRKEIRDFSLKYGVPANTIDKDWVLGHIVSTIYENDYFTDKLVFKGGTCLRKCYFENYRFSEDLDFTVLNEISIKLLKSNISKVINQVSIETDILFGKYKFEEYKYRNQLMGYKFEIPFWGANHREYPSSERNWPMIKIDITLFEKVYSQPEIRDLIHLYYIIK